MRPKPFDQAAARARLLYDAEADSGPVAYWMHRDHRLRDNWGLLLAQQLALSLQAPLAVVHCLSPSFGQACLRQYAFLARGLPEIEAGLRRLNIPLIRLQGVPGVEVPKFLARAKVRVLAMDFDPGRIKQTWRREVLDSGLAKLWEVDSRNVVPAWMATDRKEYMARTFRPRLRRLLPEFLEEPAALQRHPYDWPLPEQGSAPADALAGLSLDAGVGEAPGPEPGEKAALRLLNEFLEQRLPRYADHANDPTRNAVSGLSAHLHFGQISSLRIALEVGRANAPTEAKDAFLEQLLVRRELAENYVLHEPDHDNLSGAILGSTSTARSSSRRAPRTTNSGTPPRPKWSTPGACTATCACTGPKKSWSGAPRPKRRWTSPSGSTTAISWMAGTPTESRASCGPSPAFTTRDSKSAPCTAKYAT